MEWLGPLSGFVCCQHPLRRLSLIVPETLHGEIISYTGVISKDASNGRYPLNSCSSDNCKILELSSPSLLVTI